MKTAPVLVLIVLVGVLGWALPAGAEKAVLTDAELDGISAGAAAPAFPAIDVAIPFFAARGELRLGFGPEGAMFSLMLRRLDLAITVPVMDSGMPMVRFSAGPLLFGMGQPK